ncbi:MAG: hypothetical protein PWQ72_1500, partial [Pseudothermotoga sp.]|nr:hypothetical protein [Pseudothermotoga sp.]
IKMKKNLSKRCFWDVDIESLDIRKNKSFIISRILEHGTMEDIIALKSMFPIEEISEVVKNSRNISRSTAIFWANILDIPLKEVRACSKLPRFRQIL